MLKETFINLVRNYTKDSDLIDGLWTEIERAYAHKKRHYHTLEHLNNLLLQLTDVKPAIKNWDAILFSLFYHDVVYDVLKSNNEQKSAELARKRMDQLSVDGQTIACSEMIIRATASHEMSVDNDVNLFTDADLSVLGQPWNVYSAYYKNVRKEYSIYPDPVYNPGRKKVLKHFLAMARIFKTDNFFKLYEEQARQNMQQELDLL